MGTDLSIRFHASLDDEVMAILRTEGGWLGSHALLQRCELAKNGDQLGDVLSKLVKRGELQRHCGDVGLLYAVMGLTPPTNTPQPGPSRLLSISQLSASNGEAAKIKRASEATRVVAVQAAADTPPPAPEPEARIAKVRREHVEHNNAQIREQMLAMFREIPLRPARDFQLALDKSQSQVKDYLKALRHDGVVECIGKARAARWRWLAAPVSTLSIAESPAARTEAARKAGAQRRETGSRAVVWPLMRERLSAIFQEKGFRRTAEVAPLIDKSLNSTSKYLAQLEGEDLVRRLGKGMSTSFQWIGATLTPDPVARAPNLHPQNADSAVVECNAEAMFGFWSNGDFEIRAQGQTILLKGDVSRQLISFANRLEAAP